MASSSAAAASTTRSRPTRRAASAAWTRACSTPCASAPIRSSFCACRPTPPSTTRSTPSSSRARRSWPTSPTRCCVRWRATASRRRPQIRCSCSACASRRPIGWYATRWRASTATRRRASSPRSTRRRRCGCAPTRCALPGPRPCAPWRPSGPTPPSWSRRSCPRPSASTAPAMSAQLAAFASRPGHGAGRGRATGRAPGRAARRRAHPRRLRRRRRQVGAPGRAGGRSGAHRLGRHLGAQARARRRSRRTASASPRRRRSAAISPTPAHRSTRPTIACSSTRRAAASACCAGIRKPSGAARPTTPSRSPPCKRASSTRWRRGCARAASWSTRSAPTPTRRGQRQLARFLAAHADFHADGEPLRTWPHRDDADGFFAVRLGREVK